MESPGESGTGPPGAPSPSSFTPGHLETEKLVKLAGQPGGAGRGCEKRVYLGTEKVGNLGAGKRRARVPAPGSLLRSGCPPSGQPRTHCMTCPMPAAGRQAGHSGRDAL